MKKILLIIALFICCNANAQFGTPKKFIIEIEGYKNTEYKGHMTIYTGSATSQIKLEGKVPYESEIVECEMISIDVSMLKPNNKLTVSLYNDKGDLIKRATSDTDYGFVQIIYDGDLFK